MRTVKVRRTIEYSGTTADIEKHLANTLLAHQRVVRPGDTVPGIGLVMAAAGAPRVTIRLVSETELSSGGPSSIWRERQPKPPVQG
jgi:hypothetical protein